MDEVDGGGTVGGNVDRVTGALQTPGEKVLNALLILTVVRPVARLSVSADELSKGNLDVGEQPVRGKDEISVLTDAFNRMQRSLVKAMKMLESE